MRIEQISWLFETRDAVAWIGSKQGAFVKLTALLRGSLAAKNTLKNGHFSPLGDGLLAQLHEYPLLTARVQWCLELFSTMKPLPVVIGGLLHFPAKQQYSHQVWQCHQNDSD